MRCHRVTARSVSTIVTVPLLGALIGCQQGPQVVTSIVFDGESRSITTTDVFCTNQLNGGLVILVQDTPTRTVRVQLTQQGRLVVQKAGLRYGDMTGFVADPGEVTASKADDTFTFSGRMPPNPGESQWHTFKIQTTCPGYQDAPPPTVDAPTGRRESRVPGRPPTNGYVIGRGSWTSAANQTPARLAAIMHGRGGTHVATWADLAA